MYLGYKATDLGNGVWHYEYALHNLSSHRAVRLLEVPVLAETTVSNIGFHDIDYHSGEPYDGTDWASSHASGRVTWSTDTFAANENANALRWGTLYNFRFDANAPPRTVTASIGLFRPGSPETISVPTVGPVGPPGAPMTAPHPHDRRKNRYISFDPNKAENDAVDIAFKVTLQAITLGSCDPTEETCVNDAPDVGGTSVGRVWWVGPESPRGNGVHLLVSEPFRKESPNWPNPTHVGDCEVVPEAVYDVQAVNTDTGAESGEVQVETTLFASISSSWWGDCVGPLQKFCGGDFRTTACGDDGDCPQPDTCDPAWTLPDGAVNVDDISAALALLIQDPKKPLPHTTWVDVHGTVPDVQSSQNFGPPNYVLNHSDILQIIFGFAGRPYTFFDPADCPDEPEWP